LHLPALNNPFNVLAVHHHPMPLLCFCCGTVNILPVSSVQERNKEKDGKKMLKRSLKRCKNVQEETVV